MAKYHNWQDLVPSLKQLVSTPEGQQQWEMLKEKAADVVRVISTLPEEKMKRLEQHPRFQSAAESLGKAAQAAVRLAPRLDPHTKDLATLAIEIKLLELHLKKKTE